MVERSPVWFLNNLVKRKVMFNGKFRILDTILGTSEKRCPVVWMFTDQFGFTKVKAASETNNENILNAFSNCALLDKEEIAGHYVSEHGFDPISKTNLTNKIIDQGVFEDRALQRLPVLNVYTNKRFIIKAAKGVEKCFIQYRQENRFKSDDLIEKTLKSTSHCSYMNHTLHQVVKTIEKNLGNKEKKFKIFEISLVFIEDVFQKLWLMGTCHIKCDFIPNAKTKHLSPSNTISDLAYLHLTTSSKSSNSSSLLPTTLRLNRGQISKSICAGGFCKFVLTLSKSSSSENQYEQFVIKN
jgi:hypothetical protein